MGVSVVGVEIGSLVGGEVREGGRVIVGYFVVFLRVIGKSLSGLLGEGEILIRVVF